MFLLPMRNVWNFLVAVICAIAVTASPQEVKSQEDATKLVAAALERTTHTVRYDGSYRKIPYPGGDVPEDIGVCTDLIVRCYRAIEIDLQEEVHEDISANLTEYPRHWGLKKPDPNIDHRRVLNLQTFFRRKGDVLPVTENPDDYLSGDLVTWKLAENVPHIGIVIDRRSGDNKRPMVVHNIGNGPEVEDILFKFPITGHYRYYGQNREPTVEDESADEIYVKEIEEWGEKREKNLRRDTGWLTLVGLYLLKDGVNRFGSDPENDIVFPQKSPSHAGVFRLAEGRVTIQVDPAVEVKSENEMVRSMAMLSDTEEKTTVLDMGSFQFYIIERAGKKYVRLKDRESELLHEFDGIEKFPIDPRWRIQARIEPYDPPKKIQIPNILGYDSEEMCPGAVLFEFEGKKYKLEPMGELGKNLFFVFGDRTNGKETYGGGRFLYTDPPGPDGIVILDFNKSYNPPCVFTPYATCPLPHSQNLLQIRIEAGEKSYGVKH